MKIQNINDSIIFSAPYILRVSKSVIYNGAVLISGDKIKDTGTLSDIRTKYPNAAWRDFPSSIIMPGLVNAHVHLEYSALGPVDGRVDFVEWLKDLIQRQRTFDEEHISSSIDSAINQLINSGITSVGEVAKSGASLAPLLKSGLNGTYYNEVVAVDNVERTMSRVELEGFYNGRKSSLDGSRLIPGLFPHSLYTLSEDVLREIASFVDSERIPCGIHVAETQYEEDFIRNASGPLAELMSGLGLKTLRKKRKWKSVIEHVDAVGLLTPMTHLVHLTQLDPMSFPLLAGRGVGIVLCPRSNYYLKCGAFPFSQSLEYGLRVGLGSDSLASNASFDMFKEMRLLYDSIHAPSLSKARVAEVSRRLLYMVTMGGADILGLADDIGSLTAGKKADIAVVKVGKGVFSDSFSPEEHLVSHATADDVIFTMINGAVKYDIT